MPPNNQRPLADWSAAVAGCEAIREHQVQRQCSEQEDDDRTGADKKARAIPEHGSAFAHHDPVVQRRSPRPDRAADCAADKQQKDRPAQHRQLNRMQISRLSIAMTGDSASTDRNRDRLMCRPSSHSHDAPINRCARSLTGCE